jgi:prepilin-type processing-associated H-X9-DG protein
VVCVGIVFVGGIVAAILFPALTRARDAAYRATCQNNLKEAGLQIHKYATEHGGSLPALVNEPGYMIFGGEFAKGLDLALLQCPGEGTDYAERNEDGSVYLDSDYIYTGFAVRNQGEMEAVLAAFHAQNNNLEALMALGKIAGPDGDILPLNTALADPALVPVLVEWYMNHGEDGASVLYLDGHTEFVKHGSKFPVTDEFYEIVEEMVQQSDVS